MKFKLVIAYARKIKQAAIIDNASSIPEIVPSRCKPCSNTGQRVNLVVPVISDHLVFGGVATAVTIFQRLIEYYPEARILVLNEDEVAVPFRKLEGWFVATSAADTNCNKSILVCGDRRSVEVPVRSSDVFLTTYWNTTYVGFEILDWQDRNYGDNNRRIAYLIQDFEPGFFPWSTRYALAESTYRKPNRTIAIFNTKLLSDYCKVGGFTFSSVYEFEPQINSGLKAYRDQISEFKKKRLILVYGRPLVDRNAYGLVVQGVRKWSDEYADSGKWEVVSVGGQHPEIELSNRQTLKSLGKLSIEEYAEILSHSAIGLSLMISPHPSYPPLEMAAFGARVISNNFANKNLGKEIPRILSIENLEPTSISDALVNLCRFFDVLEESMSIPKDDFGLSGFLDDSDHFKFVSSLAKELV